jgi:hypothetical protein
MIVTEPAVLSAGVATGFIHLGNPDVSDFPVSQSPLEKQAAVRLLNVTIEELNTGAKDTCPIPAS